MEPLMTVFFENGARYNLLNSAVLELVEFVRKENIRVRRGGGARTRETRGFVGIEGAGGVSGDEWAGCRSWA